MDWNWESPDPDGLCADLCVFGGGLGMESATRERRERGRQGHARASSMSSFLVTRNIQTYTDIASIG